MKKNLTLALDADLLKSARRLALEHDTTVNQVVRDYLIRFVERKDARKAAREEMKKFFASSRFELGPITWTRDELHER